MLSVICHTTTSMKATTWHKHTLVDGQVVLYTTSVAGALTNSNSPHSKFECHQSYPVIYLPFKPVTPWSLNSLWDVSVFKAAYCAALVLSISTSSGSSWLHQHLFTLLHQHKCLRWLQSLSWTFSWSLCSVSSLCILIFWIYVSPVLQYCSYDIPNSTLCTNK